ncbi:alpha/beta fold hydrolase [Jannaschia aquimarina]|uniref:MetX protein n=1 Tax=Jannaschia aquimarina TaxID=935700 RepID=A0A0D1D6P8_9RHOB|nr:alpha/beta fold hydrolase [Jannaschia aquimarina]KIT15643.1 Homoserine O-acetyltransferase [Jannaschia aquimarina]SNT03317.1 homoserine O-acetyltransferase [Jannaschia aquimarina]
MRTIRQPALAAAISVVAFAAAGTAFAQERAFPEPERDFYVIENFAFENGSVLPEMTVSYLTIGNPENPPVLITHGTTGQAEGMLGDPFAGNLYGTGQPLDAEKYFLILVDAIGAGQSSKPSDGLRTDFPEQTLMDMVNAQKMLLEDHLGIDRLHLKIGFSMGGMLTWTWLTEYPDFMDGGVPIASLPGPMAGRNWMMRRMVIDAVRDDPAWNGGDYDEQPPMLQYMSAWFGIATSNGNLRLQEIGATREQADAFVDDRKAKTTVGDANDVMYMWNASRNFDPTPKLGEIEARVLVILSQDDERNPVELPMLEQNMALIPDAELYIVPEDAETRGHGTTYNAGYYADVLGAWMKTLPNAPEGLEQE